MMKRGSITYLSPVSVPFGRDAPIQGKKRRLSNSSVNTVEDGKDYIMFGVEADVGWFQVLAFEPGKAEEICSSSGQTTEFNNEPEKQIDSTQLMMEKTPVPQSHDEKKRVEESSSDQNGLLVNEARSHVLVSDKALRRAGTRMLGLFETVGDLSQKLEDLNNRLTVEVQQLRGQLHVSQLFEGGKFLFTCDILENLVVKLTYSLQRAVAKDLLESRIRPESFWCLFEEKNLAHLCYGRVLKRLLYLRSVRAGSYIEELLVERNIQQAEETSRAQHPGTDQHPGTEQVDQLLEFFLELAEQEVADELNVLVVDLKLTTATYLLQLKPERNMEAHRNQLHPPAYWRYSSVDQNPAPPELIDKCLASAPVSEPVEAPRDDFRNLVMVDVVLSSLGTILADHIRRMSEEVVVTIIHRVRERICNNLADTLSRYLWDTGALPASIMPGFETAVYRGGRRKKKEKEGWVLWPKGKPEQKLVLTRDGEWHDVNGNELSTPFFGCSLAELLV